MKITSKKIKEIGDKIYTLEMQVSQKETCSAAKLKLEEVAEEVLRDYGIQGMLEVDLYLQEKLSK